MNKHFRFTAIFGVCALVQCAVTWAQQDEPALPASAEAEEKAQDAPASQEVEINEDNYRQFMELKDGLQQRTIAPEDSYASRSGLQKLDKLPEESQKHLRNELREIISSGDRWQPGDENADYPYVPSSAAQDNAGLQRQEAEAWGELLDNYHAREAQIYANSARSRAAAAASGAGLSQAGASASDGQGRENQGELAGQDQGAQPGSTGDSFAPAAQNTGGEQSAEGVAQNAMEFLQQAGYQDGGANGEGAQQAGETGPATAQAQPRSKQNAATGSTTQPGSAEAGTDEAAEQAGEGTEQSAMVYLQQVENRQDGTGESGSQQTEGGGESSAAGEQQDSAVADTQDVTVEVTGSDSNDPIDDEGISQNALEYLAGEGAPVGDASQDTLSIEDLLNAGGVATGVGAEQVEPEEPPDKPDKDGGG